MKDDSEYFRNRFLRFCAVKKDDVEVLCYGIWLRQDREPF